MLSVAKVLEFSRIPIVRFCDWVTVLMNITDIENIQDNTSHYGVVVVRIYYICKDFNLYLSFGDYVKKFRNRMVNEILAGWHCG